MTMENIPWALLGGITSASLARMVAYQATGGEEGVAGIGDFVVTQTTVASGNVVVGSGGAVMVNRYPGVKNESYMCRAGDPTNVAVPPNATGSSRTDMLICRIDDWNAPGGQAVPGSLPTDTVPAAKFQVITGVSSSAKKAKDLGLNYPAIALARITVPAGTSAITQAMITDLREKAVPRRKRDLRATAQLAGRDNSLVTTTAVGEQFPNDGLWTVEVPEWATRVRFVANWGSLQLAPGTNYSLLYVVFGWGTAFQFSSEASAVDNAISGTSYSRVEGLVVGDLAVPAAARGASISVMMRGRKMDGTVALKADWATMISVDMEFLEAPTEDL